MALIMFAVEHVLISVTTTQHKRSFRCIISQLILLLAWIAHNSILYLIQRVDLLIFVLLVGTVRIRRCGVQSIAEPDKVLDVIHFSRTNNDLRNSFIFHQIH